MTTQTLTNDQATPSRVLHYALWGAQLLLGAMFIFAGWWKATTPLAELALKAPWVTDLPFLVRFIGISELAGGIGVLLPALTRIKPLLTSLAAVGLFVVMVLAAIFHGVRGEFAAIGTNAVLAGLAAFVAWGRYRAAPITPRS